MTEPKLEAAKATAPAPGLDPRDEFAKLFSDAYRILWFIAVGIVGNRSFAEDVVQEAAAIAFGKFEQFERGTNFTAWMGQMVRHVALNTRRKEQRKIDGGADAASNHRRSSPSGGSLAGLHDDAGKRTARLAAGSLPPDRGEFDDELVRAVESLSPAARACLLLRTLEGMDYRGISGLLGIPQATAMSHVHRARKLLRQRLEVASRAAGGNNGQSRIDRERKTRTE
jgi:RNA polymerase sigma-70 factor (ECF subfamily)